MNQVVYERTSGWIRLSQAHALGRRLPDEGVRSGRWEIRKSGPCSREQQVGPDDGDGQGQPQDATSPKCRRWLYLHLGDNTRKIITAPFLV